MLTVSSAGADPKRDIPDYDGPGNKYMIVPTALFDFGLLPSVGVFTGQAADARWDRVAV